MSKKKHRNNNYNGQRRITGKDLQVQTTKIELKGRTYEMNFDLMLWQNWKISLVHCK